MKKTKGNFECLELLLANVPKDIQTTRYMFKNAESNDQDRKLKLWSGEYFMACLGMAPCPINQNG